MQIFPLRFLFFGSSEANFKTAASLRVHILKCVGPTTSCSHSSWRGQQHEELNGIEESFCRSNSKTGSLYNTTIYNSDVIFSDFSMFKLHQKGKTATNFDSQYGYHTSVIWALTFPTLFLKITQDTHIQFLPERAKQWFVKYSFSSRGLRWCDRQRSWRNRALNDFGQSERWILISYANYLWSQKKFRTFQCHSCYCCCPERYLNVYNSFAGILM